MAPALIQRMSLQDKGCLPTLNQVGWILFIQVDGKHHMPNTDGCRPIALHKHDRRSSSFRSDTDGSHPHIKNMKSPMASNSWPISNEGGTDFTPGATEQEDPD